MAQPITIRHLGPDDVTVLDRVRAGVFDNPVDPALAYRFLVTGVNEIVVALIGGEVVGFVSGTALMHPDKPTGFFINEVSVHTDVRRQGVGERLVERMIDVAASRGCAEVWVLTDDDNGAARALYRKQGGAETAARMFTWENL